MKSDMHHKFLKFKFNKNRITNFTSLISEFFLDFLAKLLHILPRHPRYHTHCNHTLKATFTSADGTYIFQVRHLVRKKILAIKMMGAFLADSMVWVH